MRAMLAVYGAGVVIGLWRTDGPLRTRLALALLWPLGPIAGLVTVGGLAASLIVIALLRPR